MYNLKRNNYHQNPKASNIQTPPEVSQFIFELLGDKFKFSKFVLDPCCGKGNLLKPWKEECYNVYGIDKETSDYVDKQTDFLSWDGWDNIVRMNNSPIPWKLEPQLILCNPPFNGHNPKLGSEVWLDKIIELFGKEVPIILFVPMGFRLNSKKQGKRWTKFMKGEYPPISSIISLPRDVFPEVEFHSEILIFNIQGLKTHYFFKSC